MGLAGTDRVINYAATTGDLGQSLKRDFDERSVISGYVVGVGGVERRIHFKKPFTLNSSGVLITEKARRFGN
jgi:hypothetical protein